MGCGNTSDNISHTPEYGSIDNQTVSTEQSMDTKTTHIIECGENYDNYGTNSGHISIMVDKYSHSFMDVPMYYQQDYPDVSLGYSTVSTHGNLVTSLSMVESYLSNKFINPEAFITEYQKDYIDSNGSILKSDLLDTMCQKYNASYFIEKFDLERVIKYLDVDAYLIMLDINHASIYSNTSTYLLLLKNDAAGNIEVRDPNYNNIVNYATIDQDDKSWYSVISLCETAGNSSDIYVFKKGVPDYEKN